MHQNEDSKQLNTAVIERLNLFIRRSLASLHRRTNSAAQTHTALNQAVTLLRCYYNFIRPHGSLKFGRQLRTPAEQANLVTRKLTWRDIFQSYRLNARVPWIQNPSMREAWSRIWRCPASNS